VTTKQNIVNKTKTALTSCQTVGYVLQISSGMSSKELQIASKTTIGSNTPL